VSKAAMSHKCFWIVTRQKLLDLKLNNTVETSAAGGVCDVRYKNPSSTDNS